MLNCPSMNYYKSEKNRLFRWGMVLSSRWKDSQPGIRPQALTGSWARRFLESGGTGNPRGEERVIQMEQRCYFVMW